MFFTNLIKCFKRQLFGADIVIINDFHQPPYGGGNQFLLALRTEWERQGILVGNNSIGKKTRVILFNSFNFDFNKLRRFKKSGIRMVHRVDGPISKYRGKDEDLDRKICLINKELADKTVFQSNYSLKMHREMGLEFSQPCVIPNASDPAIFFPSNQRKPLQIGEKIKLISTSWSDNPKKGQEIYRWLDKNLDFRKFEYTFVGRCQADFLNIRKFAPVGSKELAKFLRSNHIFITASENDPCSNALIEAMSCGLPAVYYKSGGHTELVKGGGLGFDNIESIPFLLDKITQDYKGYCSMIDVLGIKDVAQKYYSFMML